MREAIRSAARTAAGTVAVPALLQVTGRMDQQPPPAALGRSTGDVELGRFAVGCADLAGSARLGRVTAPDAFALLDAARAVGCTAFDTAAVYGGGLSERILGAWMRSRRNRDDVVIIGKGGHPDAAGAGRLGRAELTDDLHRSLRRLRTDRIDLYLLHRDDPSLPVGPIMDVLHRFVQAGEVLAVGASNWTHERIEAANRYAAARGLTPFTASSPHLSLAEMHEAPWPGCTSLTGEQGADARAWHRATGTPVLAWSPLSGGYLTAVGPKDPDRAAAYRSGTNAARRNRLLELAERRGTSPERLALAYLLHLDLHVVPVVAASTPARLGELLAAGDLHLDPSEVRWLDRPTPPATTDRSPA